jgi:hypothetical protein
MFGISKALFQFTYALGHGAGTIIGTGLSALASSEPEKPPPQERQYGEAEFVSQDELKRRGIIDER